MLVKPDGMIAGSAHPGKHEVPNCSRRPGKTRKRCHGSTLVGTSLCRILPRRVIIAPGRRLSAGFRRLI